MVRPLVAVMQQNSRGNYNSWSAAKVPLREEEEEEYFGLRPSVVWVFSLKCLNDFKHSYKIFDGLKWWF